MSGVGHCLHNWLLWYFYWVCSPQFFSASYKRSRKLWTQQCMEATTFLLVFLQRFQEIRTEFCLPCYTAEWEIDKAVTKTIRFGAKEEECRSCVAERIIDLRSWIGLPGKCRLVNTRKQSTCRKTKVYFLKDRRTEVNRLLFISQAAWLSREGR